MAVYTTATALVFNQIFFPNIDPVLGYISSFGAYAVGFSSPAPLAGCSSRASATASVAVS